MTYVERAFLWFFVPASVACAQRDEALPLTGVAAKMKVGTGFIVSSKHGGLLGYARSPGPIPSLKLSAAR